MIEDALKTPSVLRRYHIEFKVLSMVPSQVERVYTRSAEHNLLEILESTWLGLDWAE